MISLEREPDASLDTRDAAYGIIANAYYELRDEWCRKEFGKTYDECTQEQQGYSRAMYATKILAPEMRYLCDVTIDVRKDALMAHVDRTDAKTGTPTDIRNALDYGRILNDLEELEDYINNVIDASSRLRSVKVRFYPGGSTDIVPDLKNMLMKKSAAVGIKYESVQDEEEDSDYMVVSQAVKAGDIIKGMVVDVSNNDAPLMLLNIVQEAYKDPALSFQEQIIEDEIFNGKIPERVQYIQDNINYPDEAKQDLNRNVLASFTIGKDGNVMNPEIKGSSDPALDAQALQVLSPMPAWIPARNENGEVIEVKYTIPVSTPLPHDLE